MNHLARKGTGTFRLHYAFAALVSLALSAWGAYAIAVPNPDSVLYLRSAEYFAAGRLQDGFDLYHWPLYSLSIAAAMIVTGAGALLAANIVNGLLTLGTVVAFIALARELSNGDRAFVTIAAIMVAFQPQLTELRPWIIRDHGYICFLVTSVYLAVSDQSRPALWRKLALVAALAAATLFRIEGLYLAVLVACYYVLARLRSATAQISVMVVFVAATTTLLPFVYSVWVTGALGKWLSGAGFIGQLDPFSAAIHGRVEILKTQVLSFGSGHGWQAYVGIVVALVASQIVRAMTPVFTVAGFFAFFPDRLIPRRALLPVVWFSAGQIPMLFMFTFIYAFVNWRYAMGLAIIAMYAAVFCMTTTWREFLMRRPRSFLVLPTLVVAITVTWSLDVPKPGRFEAYLEASDWIRANVPEDARLWTNDARIAYLADLDFRRLAIAGPRQFSQTGTGNPHDIDVFVVASKFGRPVPYAPAALRQLSPIMSFRDDDDNIVEIFAVCPEPTHCPQAMRGQVRWPHYRLARMAAVQKPSAMTTAPAMMAMSTAS